MQKEFKSHGCVYDVEFFHSQNKDIVRFYDKSKEQYGDFLSNLVVVTPSYGFLLLQYIGDDVILSGTLNNKYFHKEMMGDLLDFLEDNFPQIRNTYQPYHMDFVSVSDYEEYNGEY